MPQQVKLWTINSDGKLQHLQQARLDLESRLEEWIEADIIDLLCIDANGDLMILELKRDKTRREITAQALDYASWVVYLSHERVSVIANDYFGQKGAFEEAFRRSFGSELPETINGSHRIVIVASAIDPSSERIIEYLSRHHGVNINAVTFQYFSSPAQVELLARVFLLEPEDVEYKSRTKGDSKRKPNLTYDELQEVAEANGVGPIYEAIVELLRPLFAGTRTTRSSISFVADFRGSRSAILNLIPIESSESDGLKYQIYSLRAAENFGIDKNNINELLPSGAQPWKYIDEGPEWEGYTGYFSSSEQIQALLEAPR